jgi:hypothetical protein
MPHDRMIECQQRKHFLENERQVERWTVVPVSRLYGASSPDTRCMHCHGAVRVHKQKVEHGPRDHVEHRSRQDSEHCKGGHYFNGTHRLSTAPVQ